MSVRRTRTPSTIVESQDQGATASEVSGLTALLREADSSDRSSRGDWRDWLEPGREVTAGLRWLTGRHGVMAAGTGLFLILTSYGVRYGWVWLQVIGVSIGLLLLIGLGLLLLVSISLGNMSGVRIWIAATWAVLGIALATVILPFAISRFLSSGALVQN